MPIVSLMDGRLFLADPDSAKDAFADDSCHLFETNEDLVYIPFCDDFGPMNFADTCQFVEMIDEMLEQNPGKAIVYLAENKSRKLTNAIFLLGSYLIMTLRCSPDEVWSQFRHLEEQLEMYRDATFSDAIFRLTLLDCWNGLKHARDLGWTDRIDLDEYTHYDNPLEGDLHTIVPDKLVAFKGPHTLSASRPYLDQNGCRLFSPSFYLDAFSDMNVTTVVRLNEEEYQAREFEDHGISCVDLEFEDCSNPPTHVIIEFLHVVDRAEGVVAVHCKAGLGRTGTLIAIYMMRTHGFTAREAMGWLRIVRPGSVIGDQQSFLCRIEAVQRDMDAAADDPEEAAAAAAAADADAEHGCSCPSADDGLCACSGPAGADSAADGTAASAAEPRYRWLEGGGGGGDDDGGGGGGDGGGGSAQRALLAEQVAAALHSPTRTALKLRKSLRQGGQSES